MHPHELAVLERMPPGRRNATPVRLWTLKEAYTKAIGPGMRFPFAGFGFLPDDRPTLLRAPDGTPTDTGAEWQFGTFSVDERYTVSVAVGDTRSGAARDTAVRAMLDPALVEVTEGSVRTPAHPGETGPVCMPGSRAWPQDPFRDGPRTAHRAAQRWLRGHRMRFPRPHRSNRPRLAPGPARRERDGRRDGPSGGTRGLRPAAHPRHRPPGSTSQEQPGPTC